MTTTDKTPLTQDELSGFIGTENYYRHSLNRSLLYTDGVKFLAERAGAYWLIDAIAIANALPALKAEPFQSWKLTVSPGKSGLLVCEDGNSRSLWTERMQYTDFPLPEITLFCTDNVLMLTSEY